MTALAIGIDIGGTKISAGLVDDLGLVAGTLTRESTPSRSGPDRIVATVARLVGRLTDRAGADSAVGVGSAGVIDADGSVFSATDSIRGWQGFDLSGSLARVLGRPVRALNDVHAAALGEARLGAGSSFESFLMVTVGTGVGGAICIHGEPLRGVTGTAGSLGHIAARDLPSRACTCGQSGHIEAWASGPAIERAYAQSAGRKRPLSEIAAAARGDARGDVDLIAELAVLTGARVLGVGLADAMNLTDLDAVIVGGGVASIGDWYLDAVRDAYRSSALPGPSHAPIHAAGLGPTATLVGAGLHALHN